MEFIAWMRANPTLLWWLGIGSVVMFLAGLVLVPLVVIRMPADYFLRLNPGSKRPPRHPALRVLFVVAKNILGAFLVLGGLLQLALPGQGLLSILLGVSLLDFPGKRRLELYIVTRKVVSRAMNWMRARAGRPPLRLPEVDH